MKSRIFLISKGEVLKEFRGRVSMFRFKSAKAYPGCGGKKDLVTPFLPGFLNKIRSAAIEREIRPRAEVQMVRDFRQTGLDAINTRE